MGHSHADGFNRSFFLSTEQIIRPFKRQMLKLWRFLRITQLVSSCESISSHPKLVNMSPDHAVSGWLMPPRSFVLRSLQRHDSGSFKNNFCFWVRERLNYQLFAFCKDIGSQNTFYHPHHLVNLPPPFSGRKLQLAKAHFCLITSLPPGLFFTFMLWFLTLHGILALVSLVLFCKSQWKLHDYFMNSFPLLFAVALCLSYFSVAVKRHHVQGNLQKKEFNGAYSHRGLESIAVTVGSIMADRHDRQP